MDYESLAKTLLASASGVVAQFSPMGATIVTFAAGLAFEIYDLEKSGAGPVAVAQLAGDRVTDLLEKLKVGV